MNQVEIVEKGTKIGYKIGQVFYDKQGENLFIISQIEADKMTMVRLKDGNRWRAALKVEDITNITLTEMEQYIGPKNIL